MPCTAPIDVISPATTALATAAESHSASDKPLCRLEEINQLMESVAASWHTSSRILEMRESHRVALTAPIAVSMEHPTDPGGPPLTVIGSGRDVSPRGVAFSHMRPLPCREAILTFALSDGSFESVLTRLTWCRFSRAGIYFSGGKFVRIVDCPFYTAQWDQLPPG